MPTLVDQAILTIPGFDNVYKTIYQQVTLKGQSQSTLDNYIRRVAGVCMHFKCLPEQITDDELNEYLTALAISKASPSRSTFKHVIYGLRYYYRHIGDTKRAIRLPKLQGDTRLPVILNRSELKELFNAPKLLKHRIVLALIYSAGLRGREVINLRINDVDFERKTIHIRQSKYKKDRIIPLSDFIASGLKKYLSVEHPYQWLFNGKDSGSQYSVQGLSWVIHEALKKTNIKKEINLHSLRHSYATHLLEEGVNIVTVKELLGHAQITTTIIYLHVAQLDVVKAHSPLDTLYNIGL